MHLLRTNIAVGSFLSNFLDFSQFTVDSSENDTENNYEVFFFSFYILHLAYTFIMLSGKLVVLLFQSYLFPLKSDGLVKVTKA